MNTRVLFGICALATGMAAVANQALAAAHATSAALTLTSDGTAADTWSIVPVRAKDIFVAVIGANTERKPLGLGSAWPRSAFTPIGHGMDADIAEMTFANSSDYFTALIDGHRIGKDDWSPFVVGLDWTTFAGGGVPPKEGAGRLTAANNIWTVAANVTDDMPDVIPVLVSRNVDPSSLVPGGDDLKAQFVRPSRIFMSPFEEGGFVLVRRGGAVVVSKSERVSLHELYRWYDVREIRAAFQKIRYLTPDGQGWAGATESRENTDRHE